MAEYEVQRPPSATNRAKLMSLPDVVKMKVVSLGNPGVGKSCLIKRYSEERVK